MYNYTRFDRVQLCYLKKTRIKLFLNVSAVVLWCVNYAFREHLSDKFEVKQNRRKKTPLQAARDVRRRKLLKINFERADRNSYCALARKFRILHRREVWGPAAAQSEPSIAWKVLVCMVYIMKPVRALNDLQRNQCVIIQPTYCDFCPPTGNLVQWFSLSDPTAYRHSRYSDSFLSLRRSENSDALC